MDIFLIIDTQIIGKIARVYYKKMYGLFARNIIFKSTKLYLVQL